MDSERLNISRPGDVADYPHAIQYLHTLGVPTSFVAQLFQTTSPNIRKIRSRGPAKLAFLPTPRITPLLKLYGSDEKHWAKMRAMSASSYQRRSDSRINDLAGDLRAIFEETLINGKFAENADDLQRFRMYAATASNPMAFRMQSLVHFIIAMMENTAGDDERGSASAKRAMLACVKGFEGGFGEKLFLELYTAGAGFAAHAAISLRAVAEASEVLEEMEAATLCYNGRLTSPYLGLKGQLLMMECRYSSALECFHKAQRIAAEYEEFENEFLAHWSLDRMPNLLEAKVDDAFQLARDAALYFGDGTPRHWRAASAAVATAFVTDSEAAIQEAMDILTAMHKSPHLDLYAKRGHFLLSITPKLRFDLPKRTAWIRQL